MSRNDCDRDWKVSKEREGVRFIGVLDLDQCAPVVFGGIGEVNSQVLMDERGDKRLSKVPHPKEPDTH